MIATVLQFPIRNGRVNRPALWYTKFVGNAFTHLCEWPQELPNGGIYNITEPVEEAEERAATSINYVDVYIKCLVGLLSNKTQ